MKAELYVHGRWKFYGYALFIALYDCWIPTLYKNFDYYETQTGFFLFRIIC